MTREHDALRDLIAPVALGAGTDAETTRVEAHAAACAVCREELAALRSAAEGLAVEVPQMEPPPALRARLMETVRAEAPAREAAALGAAAAPAAAPAPRPGRPSLLGWLRQRPWPVAAGLAVAVVALLTWNVALQAGRGDDDPISAVAVRGTADAPGVAGTVVYMPGQDTAVVRLASLPELREGEAYQLWVLRDDAPPRSAGLLEPSGPGQALGAASGLRDAVGVAVTAQPRDARAAPQGPILVQAALGAS